MALPNYQLQRVYDTFKKDCKELSRKGWRNTYEADCQKVLNSGKAAQKVFQEYKVTNLPEYRSILSIMFDVEGLQGLIKDMGQSALKRLSSLERL